MLSPTVYIAGPITGIDNYKPRFEHADTVLRSAGYETRTPLGGPGMFTPLGFVAALHTPESGPSWHDYMRQAICLLAQVDGVALLDGWENSRGAAWEQRIATEVLAIPCLPIPEWLELGGMMP